MNQAGSKRRIAVELESISTERGAPGDVRDAPEGVAVDDQVRDDVCWDAALNDSSEAPLGWMKPTNASSESASSTVRRVPRKPAPTASSVAACEPCRWTSPSRGNSGESPFYRRRRRSERRGRRHLSSSIRSKRRASVAGVESNAEIKALRARLQAPCGSLGDDTALARDREEMMKSVLRLHVDATNLCCSRRCDR